MGIVYRKFCCFFLRSQAAPTRDVPRLPRPLNHHREPQDLLPHTYLHPRPDLLATQAPPILSAPPLLRNRTVILETRTPDVPLPRPPLLLNRSAIQEVPTRDVRARNRRPLSPRGQFAIRAARTRSARDPRPRGRPHRLQLTCLQRQLRR